MTTSKPIVYRVRAFFYLLSYIVINFPIKNFIFARVGARTRGRAFSYLLS
nr:MAG TPA: hypothetical protein [Caudoviricetes sp.]